MTWIWGIIWGKKKGISNDYCGDSKSTLHAPKDLKFIIKWISKQTQ